jgi:hypothetical protein
MEMLARDFYIKWKERKREQDSEETERECVRGRKMKMASAIK